MQNDAGQAMHLKYVINLCLLFSVSFQAMDQLFLSRGEGTKYIIILRALDCSCHHLNKSL